MVHKLGRRANNGESSSIAIPPPLPPSVEEAYRRKCVQLKRRTNEVEEDNEAARLRLLRLRRGVEKLRLERAFLLDQLAKRTSTNVEDSDGSPSPPPTPQDKPLRSKRGHRKPSVVAALESGTNGPPPTFINQNEPLAQRSNGVSDSGGSSKTAKKQSASAFELYCAEHRAAAEDSKEEDVTVEEELARGWKELPQSQKDEYTAKEKEAAVDKDKDNEKDKDKDKDKDKEEEKTKEARSAAAESPAEDTPAQDDDVEMENED
ncbi:hypothetical protein M406DRAFT_247667 [Cryphonectria parasitica EP155]|uniref:HMG box domain-containing protein n=1 Tax=Cryphonectria parasitica (strain ATCC 38755 / EP155) TaxID=660469 RepID=A0A9P4YAR8_CRYP1|nr:uncharacterized protein M406DRAFT_247667 [Cryphonectria parasitica EP155]KAF3770154.1 hypothetical protein M406DRAFT_247667 [Cryphonectria parasitica EP155]